MHDAKPHARAPCGAKTRSGQPCKNKAVLANGRCRMHGGKSLVGIASPSLKDGRYSKYIPGELKERYEEAQTDNDLLALREEIAVVRALLSTNLEKMDTGEASAVWQGLVKLRSEVVRAQSIQDTEKLWQYASTLVNLVERAERVEAAREDFLRTVEQLRKLVESEQKRLEKMQQMIRYEDLALFVRRVLTSIRCHVSDPRERAAIQEDLSAYVRGGTP